MIDRASQVGERESVFARKEGGAPLPGRRGCTGRKRWCNASRHRSNGTKAKRVQQSRHPPAPAPSMKKMCPPAGCRDSRRPASRAHSSAPSRLVRTTWGRGRGFVLGGRGRVCEWAGRGACACGAGTGRDEVTNRPVNPECINPAHLLEGVVACLQELAEAAALAGVDDPRVHGAAQQRRRRLAERAHLGGGGGGRAAGAAGVGGGREGVWSRSECAGCKATGCYHPRTPGPASFPPVLWRRAARGASRAAGVPEGGRGG